MALGEIVISLFFILLAIGMIRFAYTNIKNIRKKKPTQKERRLERRRRRLKENGFK